MKTKLVFLLVGIMLATAFFSGCTPAEQPKLTGRRKASKRLK
jgi:hypothetical protein